MPFDAVHIKKASLELENIITGGRIDKITSPDSNTIRLVIYANFKVAGLVLCFNSNNPHFYITSRREKEKTATIPFATHLKNHIVGASVIKVEVKENERILKLHLEKEKDSRTINYCLICEFLGKLTNGVLLREGIVLAMLKKGAQKAGEAYIDTTVQDKISPLDFDALKAVLSGEQSAADIQKAVAGLSISTINEAIFRAKASLDLAGEIFNLANFNAFSPCYTDTDFFLTPFLHLDVEFTTTSSLLEAMEEVYSTKVQNQKEGEKKRALIQSVKTKIAKVENRLSGLLSRVLSSKDFENDREQGELILSNLHNQGYCKIEAQKCFDTYKQKKRTIEATAPQIEAAKTELEYLKSILTAIERADELDELSDIEKELQPAKKFEKKSKKPIKQSKKQQEIEQRLKSCKHAYFEGYTILTGKSNLQNDCLVRSSRPYDIWLHVKDIHSAHTVIVNPAKEMPPISVIRFAAKECIKHSKILEGQNTPVDYCFIKSVQKPKSASPGLVVYREHRTVFV